jgi:hypothetical protein
MTIARWGQSLVLASAVVLSRCNCNEDINRAEVDVPIIDVCVTPAPGEPERCYEAWKAEQRSELCSGGGECRRPELTLDMGSVPAGSGGSTKVVLKNLGGAALVVKELELSAETPTTAFAVNPDPQGMNQDLVTLEQDESLEVAITLRGNVCGAHAAKFRIFSNDAAKPAGAPLAFDPGPPDSPVILNVVGRVSGPCLCAQPATGVLDFGRVAIGRSLVKRFSFESCGDEPLVVSNTEITSSVNGRYTLEGTVLPEGGVLAPGEIGHADVKYTPVSLTVDEGEMEIETNAPTASSFFVLLRGEGVPRPACILGALPDRASFGPVATTSTRTFRIYNQGQIACRLHDVQRTTGSADFTLTDGYPDPAIGLAPGASHLVEITYAPNDSTYDDAVFTALADDIDGFSSSATISVSGNPVLPSNDGCVLDIQPDFGDFGSLSIGQTNSINFTLKNIGHGNAFLHSCNISDALIVGDTQSFRMGTLTFLQQYLPPGGVITSSVSVYFEPQSQGIKTAVLRVSSNSLTGAVRDVPLWGNAVGGTLCVDVNGATPATLPYDELARPVVDFGAIVPPGESVRNVTLTNCGVGRLIIRGVEMDAAGGLQFIRELPAPADMPVELEPNQSTTLRVKYRAQNASGDFGAATVLSNASNGTQARIDLRGNYSGDCTRIIRCSPSIVGFGGVDTDTSLTKTATCSNFGSEPITVSNVTLSGDGSYRHVGSTLVTLAPGESFGAQITCAPTTGGTKNGQVTITSNACERSPYVLTLDCSGIVPELPECIGSDTYTPIEKWRWQGSPNLPSDFDDVWSTPVVINLTDDNGDGRVDVQDVPDVVFTAFSSGFPADPSDPVPAAMVAVSGRDGHELWTFGKLPAFKADQDAIAFNAQAHMAAADIDADGLAEIIGVSYKWIDPPDCEVSDITCRYKGRYVYGTLYAIENDGSFKWESERWHLPDAVDENFGAPVLGDMNGDGVPEIAYGNAVFDNNGTLIFEGETSTDARDGHGEGYMTSIMADITGDGLVDLVAGRSAFRADGSVIYSRSDVYDGFPVVLNLDNDPQAEIVMLTTDNQLVALEHDGTTKYGPYWIHSEAYDENGQEMPFNLTNLAVGNVDTDGYPEIIVAATNYIHIFEHDFTEWAWKPRINDQSGASGPTMFDFEGDGVDEIVHADESALLIYGTQEMELKYEAVRWSATITDNPVVVDVDNDGHAELLTVQEIIGRKGGVICYGNFKNNWVGTSRIWNQHSYHITNVSESGVVPAVEGSGWLDHNVFRANVVRCE